MDDWTFGAAAIVAVAAFIATFRSMGPHRPTQHKVVVSSIVAVIMSVVVILMMAPLTYAG